MKRTPLKKGNKQLKRTPFKPSISPKLLRRKKLRVVGTSTATEIKNDIQSVLRQIVIRRDKKCILYGKRCWNVYGVNDDGVVWQAEHLIERSNSATYADTRLVVLVCKNCHGWKHFTKSNHDKYDEWVREVLPADRVAHWDRCRKEKYRVSKIDWKLALVGLKQELKKLSPVVKD